MKRQKKLADYQSNPNIALVSFFMCAKTDEEARERADGETFFQFSLKYYGASSGRQRPPPGTVNMWDEYNKWKKRQSGGPGSGAARRPDRLAGHHPQEAAQVPGVQHRPGGPAQPGRQEHARAHLQIARAVRQGSDAGVPRGDPEHTWKEQVLNREIELEEIDTTAFKERYGKLAMSVAPAKAAAG